MPFRLRNDITTEKPFVLPVFDRHLGY